MMKYKNDDIILSHQTKNGLITNTALAHIRKQTVGIIRYILDIQLTLSNNLV